MRNVACLAGIMLAVSTLAAQKADPAAILAVAADYLASYERDVVAVVAQEDYRQRVPSLKIATRQLRSDLLMIADAERGWLEFRDVFEVDGQSVRDHDDRLAQLFLKPHPNPRLQAARIVEESARFNLSPAGVTLHRTLNIPLEALRFLRKANQPRSQFRIVGEERTDVGTLVVLQFQEQAKPRLIQSPGETPASGRFWIDPTTGAVIRSELHMSAPDLNATISVRFARQLEPSIWLPASMAEEYDAFDRFRRASAISGYATYSNFRRFRVDVSSVLKSD